MRMISSWLIRQAGQARADRDASIVPGPQNRWRPDAPTVTMNAPVRSLNMKTLILNGVESFIVPGVSL